MVQDKTKKLRGEITSQLVVIVVLTLLISLVLWSLIKEIRANEKVTVRINPTKEVYVCFDYPTQNYTYSMCHLVKYEDLRTWCRKEDLIYKYNQMLEDNKPKE